jgi:hypothetical protein
MSRQFRSVQKIVGYLLEKIRGPRVISEMSNNGLLQTVMTGVSIGGLVITITCTQLAKHCAYNRRWIKDRAIYAYEVKVEVDGYPPEHLRDTLSHIAYFPDILTSWSSHAAQREAAIGAYLDIIIARLSPPTEKRFDRTR